MKTTIKVLFWLIVLALIGLLIYQNQDYFLTKTTLTVDFKIDGWQWTIPALENVYFFAVCFAVGLFLAGFKMLRVKWSLNSIINSKNKEIDALQERISQIKSELDVFQHDPYIKKELDKQAAALESLAQPEGNENGKENDKAVAAE